MLKQNNIRNPSKHNSEHLRIVVRNVALYFFNNIPILNPFRPLQIEDWDNNLQLVVDEYFY